MKIEKGPGWDWTVTYQWEDEVPEVLAVFGCVTIEEAIKEARYSLDVDEMGYAILGAKRMEA